VRLAREREGRGGKEWVRKGAGGQAESSRIASLLGSHPYALTLSSK